ncbi:2Fe-2S iron-sulfur cluster-binding protein, partial [Acinetobacter oleivorans]|uniref:2Fe-2S iron-sulfur cluster-binding protein n=1 Tax=Acinetobacter oleivorans TaxID=1148157 RepID=UPI0035A24B9F
KMGHSVALNFADGKTFFISVNNDELLLDAAVRQGINLPLDCRVTKHYCLGRISHELVQVFPDNRTVLMGDDYTNGGLFMFVA